MKRWQKTAVIAVLIAILLAVGGILFYRFYIVPKYLEPIAEKFSEYVQDDKVLDSLYADAKELHDEGILTDSVYTNFVDAYTKHTRDDLAYAHSILDEQEAKESEDSSIGKSLSARYASNRVGVEIIQVNDGDDGGKASSSYSDARTSDRRRAEDIVEAEKIIAEAESAETATEKPELDEKYAYEKLKANMTASEFTTLTSIIAKLDRGMLKSFMTNADKEGLKEYLHSKLNDSDYKSIVNLGYKYVYLFIDE